MTRVCYYCCWFCSKWQECVTIAAGFAVHDKSVWLSLLVLQQMTECVTIAAGFVAHDKSVRLLLLVLQHMKKYVSIVAGFAAHDRVCDCYFWFCSTWQCVSIVAVCSMWRSMWLLLVFQHMKHYVTIGAESAAHEKVCDYCCWFCSTW